VAVLVAALSLVLQLAGAEARPLDEVIESKELRVIAYLDNAPFSWDENGEALGVDVELGRAIARELGVAPRIILRMQGETADDDLRVNVWKGPLTGGGVGDVMMHVPTDREFMIRNREAVIGNPYFHEQIAVAIHPDLTGPDPTFDVFKTNRIGVQLGTVADYFLMTYGNGALINNVAHHLRAEQGIREFKERSVAAMMGVRSKLEAMLKETGTRAAFVTPEMDGIVRRDWVVGMAWKENSRDLGYAIEAALQKIVESGEMKQIYERYGVTYVPPPLVDRH